MADKGKTHILNRPQHALIRIAKHDSKAAHGTSVPGPATTGTKNQPPEVKEDKVASNQTSLAKDGPFQPLENKKKMINNVIIDQLKGNEAGQPLDTSNIIAALKRALPIRPSQLDRSAKAQQPHEVKAKEDSKSS